MLINLFRRAMRLLTRCIKRIKKEEEGDIKVLLKKFKKCYVVTGFYENAEVFEHLEEPTVEKCQIVIERLKHKVILLTLPSYQHILLTSSQLEEYRKAK